MVPAVLFARFLITRSDFWHHAALAARHPVSTRLLDHPWEVPSVRHPAFGSRRRPWPWVYLAVVALIALLFGNLALSGVADLVGNSDHDLAAESGQVLGSLPFAFIGALIAARLYRSARRSAVLSAVELRASRPEPPVLYLRSFRDDDLRVRARATNGRSFLERLAAISFEEVLTDHLWRYGPVVSLGHPRETKLPLGAARTYADSGEWRRTAEELMASAALIVLVAGRSEGLAWELETIVRRGFIGKMVIVFPPPAWQTSGDGVAELPARWSALCDTAQEVGLALPRDIEPVRTWAVLLPGTGNAVAITCSAKDDWTYETVLDAAADTAIGTRGG